MKSRALDQFYTRTEVADLCLDLTKKYLENNNIIFDLWLEPSVGTGAFYNLLPNNRVGIDLDPKVPGIVCSDFLDFIATEDKYVTIGNPPFGKNSSLAIKFINKASTFSEVVAFILPKTFKKASITNRLSKNLHLDFEYELPNDSFIFNNEKYNVPCVFQIWKKKDFERIQNNSTASHKDIIFAKKHEANVAIQRVGNNAGLVKVDFEKYAVSSHYFLIATDKTIDILKSIDWSTVKYNTAGNPSISRGELISKYLEALKLFREG